MNVYLVRHGIAIDLGDYGCMRDADRRLSDEGITRTREVARGLRSVIRDEAIRVVSSPLVRCYETAELLAKGLGVSEPLELLDGLRPGGDVEAVVDWLEQQPPASLMLVGHMPDIADLASCLVCPQGVIQASFRKAAVMCVSFESRAGRGRGILEWFLPPGVLRRLA